MAKRVSTEEKLGMLRELEKGPVSPDMIEELSRAISGANNILVAKASQVAGKRGIIDLIPNMVKAFDRFMKNPIRTDKGCLAKESIIEALDTLCYEEVDIFVRGIKYNQREPSYLGANDTAAVLRGKCAFALSRIGYSEIFFDLCGLLMDSESQSRIAAAITLGNLPRDESELLLRIKILAGDKEPSVLKECFTSLIRINPERSITFIAEFLTPKDTILSELAAFALGESRQESAFEILRKQRENIMYSVFQDMLLLPIAMTRIEEAFEYLLEVIKSDHQESAVEAVKACLMIYRRDDCRRRIKEAALSRNEAKVSNAFFKELKQINCDA